MEHAKTIVAEFEDVFGDRDRTRLAHAKDF